MSLRLLSVGFATAAALATTTAAPAVALTPAPTTTGHYIVVVHPAAVSALDPLLQHVARLGGGISHVYRHALSGFAVSAPAALVSVLRAHPAVAYVERSQRVRASVSQTGAPWGLDRIDQRALPVNRTYSYGLTGKGVTAYVIDTGILLTHSDFGGRALKGFDAVTPGGSAADCNGHGTHVAGSLGGSTYGVAKAARLVAVRVLGCEGDGETAGVIAGIDWVTGHHRPGQPAVANMSLGGSVSRALDDAVRRSIADGISYAVAAGNGNVLGSGVDACGDSPGRVTEALTVGATDRSDARATFSNFGRCVDVYAPGVDIASAWHTSPTATNTISGTSMASPHAAGVAALVLQRSPRATPQAVHDRVVAVATKGIVSGSSPGGGLLGLGGSGEPVNNHLLFAGV
ncbi:MAG TPA: S8 family peptidase [Mycobacteriales bacterium]|nr:S8 family peptidase [Mycobacteriales bacterium]